MKKILCVAIVGLIMVSCSSSKYAAHFQYYKSNSGFSGGYGQLKPSAQPVAANTLVASTRTESIALPVEIPTAPTTVQTETARKTYLNLSKAERKAVRKEIKSEIKNYVKAKKNGMAHATQGSIDHDLKLAAIFGAVGIVALIIGGDVFWIIGGIALIIGVVFFVKWLMRQ